GDVLLVFLEMLYLFFFSRRRRHTRSKHDWSSDVCSSDHVLDQDVVDLRVDVVGGDAGLGGLAGRLQRERGDPRRLADPGGDVGEIGRASWRERVEGSCDGEYLG